MDRVRNAASTQELMNSFKDFGRSVADLADKAGRRQQVEISFVHVVCSLEDRC